MRSILITLYVMSLFSCYFQNSLCLGELICNVSRGNLWVDLVLGPLRFMYLDAHIPPMIWEVFSHDF